MIYTTLLSDNDNIELIITFREEYYETHRIIYRFYYILSLIGDINPNTPLVVDYESLTSGLLALKHTRNLSSRLLIKC